MKRKIRETCSGGVVVRRCDGVPCYLLILDGHGNWGFPKGHQREGETLLDTARREVTEETGVEDLELLGGVGDIEWTFDRRRRTVRKTCHFFLFETSTVNLVPRLREGITECQWLPYTEARSVLTFPQARGILDRAAARWNVDARTGDSPVSGGKR